jgi:endonuclease/exonuclease/phosphatase family metal-dependent hydrolase
LAVCFGAIAKLSPAFTAAVDALTSLPGNPLVGAALAVTLIAGLTGSASGGQAIALPILAPHYLDLGVDAQALHRVVAIASGGLDSLPHNGYVVTTIRGVCRETHRSAYWPMFCLTVPCRCSASCSRCCCFRSDERRRVERTCVLRSTMTGLAQDQTPISGIAGARRALRRDRAGTACAIGLAVRAIRALPRAVRGVRPARCAAAGVATARRRSRGRRGRRSLERGAGRTADAGGVSIPARTAAFTVATVNLQYTNTRHAQFLAWLAGNPADLVVVQEVTEAWAGALSGSQEHPHRFLLAREDPYGIGVLSRWPLESVRTIDLARDGLPSVEGIIEIGGQRIRFLGLHTHWPVLPELARLRDITLQQAAATSSSSDLPVILLGDLNLTPDSPAFTRLLEAPGCVTPWKAGASDLAGRLIARAAHRSRSRLAATVRRGWHHGSIGIGSDHRPVTARIRLFR